MDTVIPDGELAVFNAVRLSDGRGDGKNSLIDLSSDQDVDDQHPDRKEGDNRQDDPADFPVHIAI
jgi:hypothetical protein